MKKKSVKAAFYAGAVILACFYLLVLWWGKNPDVGLEYRMYYLTHELSDWPGYGKLSYEPGTTEYCTTLTRLIKVGIPTLRWIQNMLSQKNPDRQTKRTVLFVLTETTKCICGVNW